MDETNVFSFSQPSMAIGPERGITRGLADVVARATLIDEAARGGEDPYTSLLLGLTTARDPTSLWLQKYIEWAHVKFDAILAERAIPPNKSLLIRSRTLSSEEIENIITKSIIWHTNISVAILSDAAELMDLTTQKPSLPLDVRHVVAAYPYRINGRVNEYARDAGILTGFGFDLEDWSAAFLSFVKVVFPDELDSWVAVHTAAFKNKLRLPHPLTPDSRSGKRTFRTALELYYEDSKCGSGGGGTVYKVSTADGTPYAIKVLKEKAKNSDAARRFKNEIIFCSRCSNKNILAILDYGLTRVGTDERPFYVMQYYDHSLRDLMAQRIAHEDALPLFFQLLGGVEFAHSTGVWHRDLKPENILYDNFTNTLVVADFGIARLREEELYTAVKTKDEQKLANFQYAAPEQRVRGRATAVDGRADIFALGLILNEMFTGEIAHGTDYRSIGMVSPAHGFLDAIVARMLKQSPDDRFKNIAEFKSMLHA